MDTYDFLADPRTLTMAERHALREQHDRDQAFWFQQVQTLAEEPILAKDFPAFLLATQPFEDLGQKLQGATSRSQLSVAVADELDWFVRVFADYLRSEAGEEVFPETPRLTG